MKTHRCLGVVLFALALFSVSAVLRAAVTLPNPILFVTQVELPKERNGNVSNTFVSVVSLFGNHLADTLHAGRGGDLWLMTPKQGLVNRPRNAGFGARGVEAGGRLTGRAASGD